MAISISTQLDIEQALRDDLSRYLCGSIWNTPLTELRRNIVLRAMNKGRCVKHVCDIGRSYVSTPDIKYNNQAHEYYIYAAACCCMGGLVVDCGQSDVKNLTHYGEWVRLDDYLNIRPFDLRIHTTHGEWMHRNFIFIRNHPDEDMFLIAIDTKMANQVIGNAQYSFSSMYMSVYYDSDNSMNHLADTSPTIDCYHVTNTASINSIYRKYTEMDHIKSFMFINGRLSTPASLIDIKKNDYVEFVYDPDIICNVVIDTVNYRESHMYRSSIDGTLKYIVHIPKEKNPENYLLTHNTCDIFITPLNTSPVENANLKGLFVHRFNTSHREYEYTKTGDTKFVRGRTYYTFVDNEYRKATIPEEFYGAEIPQTSNYYVRTTSYMSDRDITQITHNDFGISERLLHSYFDVLGSSECSIRVVVRRHSKSNTLDRDCNYIRFLYELDDETIINFLNGTLASHCPFWTAVELEKSEWVKALFDVPRTIVPENTQHFINALGYYNAICVVTPRVTTGVYTNLNTYTLDFTIPRSMQTCDELDALFTVNGRLQRTTKYVVRKEYQYLRFDMGSNYPIHVGDQLRAEIFEKKPDRAQFFTPSAALDTFEIPEDSADIDFDLYMVKVAESTPIPDYYTQKYMSSITNGYLKVDRDRFISGIDNVYRTEIVDADCVAEGCENITHRTSVTRKILTKRKVKFSSSAFGHTFLIVSKEMYGRFTESDMEASGGNTRLSGIDTPVGSCTELLHAGNLKITCKHWTDDGTERIPMISKDWNVIAFCNGRELVEGIDYTVTNITDSEGYMINRAVVFAVNGLGRAESINDSDYYDMNSYLHYDDNTFDLIVTDDVMFSRFFGFVSSDDRYNPGNPLFGNNDVSVIEILPYVFWFNEFSKISVDGYTVFRPLRRNGQLKFNGPYRNGALYSMRGVVPTETIEFIEKYKDNSADLYKLNCIARYMRMLNPLTENDLSVIQHSHHITSIAANCLVKDVMTGDVTLHTTTAENEIRAMIAPYESLKKYDPVFNGALYDITISGSGSVVIDGSYYLVDRTANGSDRVWKNRANNGMSTLSYNSNSQRWELAVTSRYSRIVYYYSLSPMDHDPWTLVWSKQAGALPVPEILMKGLDSRFVDIMPSYTSDMHDVPNDIMLRRCLKVLLPTDATKDGVTTI